MMEEEERGASEERQGHDGVGQVAHGDSSGAKAVAASSASSLAADPMVEVKLEETEEVEEVDLMREIESFMAGDKDDQEEGEAAPSAEAAATLEAGEVVAGATASPVKKLQQALAEEVAASETAEDASVPAIKEAEEPEAMESLRQRVLELEGDRGQLAAEAMDKDRELGRLEGEVGSLRGALQAREESLLQAREEAEARWNRLKEESDAKVAELKKAFISANRDKESMVMKYAMGEREVIVQRKGKEEAERKLRSAIKEKEELQNRLKAFTDEKTKAQMVADSRVIGFETFRKGCLF